MVIVSTISTTNSDFIRTIVTTATLETLSYINHIRVTFATRLQTSRSARNQEFINLLHRMAFGA